MRLIDADALYEQTAEWEAQALAQVEEYNPEDNRDKWLWWSAVLKERSAFKHDVADASTIDPVAQPEPSQIARDIATILENEQDMRVILKNAQPERKKGRWVEVTDGTCIWKVCDQCGEKPLWNEWRTDRCESNYCPNCGARMDGGEQDG